MKLTCSNYVEFNSVCELIATQLKQFRKLAGGGGGIIFAWPTEKRPMKMGFIIINLKGQPTRMLKSYPTDLGKIRKSSARNRKKTKETCQFSMTMD